MTKNQQEAIERACGHENLLVELVAALRAYTDYTQAGIEMGEASLTERAIMHEAIAVLARATSQDVK